MAISVKTQHYYLVKEDCRVFYFISFVWKKKGSFEVCMSARVWYETRIFHLALLSLFKVQLCGLKTAVVWVCVRARS